MTDQTRQGEIALSFDPAAAPGDARLVFIGRVRSPWRDKDECPKNMAAARADPRAAAVEIEPAYRAGLDRLETPAHLWVLTWLDRARRDLVVQRPRHADGPRAVFSLRSPVRPNPIGLHLVEVTAIDVAGGLIDLAAIDVLDETPVLDLKPYLHRVDGPGGGTDER